MATSDHDDDSVPGDIFEPSAAKTARKKPAFSERLDPDDADFVPPDIFQSNQPGGEAALPAIEIPDDFSTPAIEIPNEFSTPAVEIRRVFAPASEFRVFAPMSPVL